MSILYSCVKESYATLDIVFTSKQPMPLFTCKIGFFSEGHVFHKPKTSANIRLNKNPLIIAKIKNEWSFQTKRLIMLVPVLVYLFCFFVCLYLMG